MPYRRFMQPVIRAIGLGCLGLVLLLCSGCTQDLPKFSAVDITGADYAKDFSMADQNGVLRSMKDFQGKVVVMFFGYTQCPDVCPTTMADLAKVKKQLGADGDKLQVLFVSLDPERDTPALLKAYMANFDPTFLALSTSLDKLPAVAKEFKVFYAKVPGPTPTSYTLDHSAGSYVFDTKGKVRLFARYGGAIEPLVADVRLLLKQS